MRFAAAGKTRLNRERGRGREPPPNSLTMPGPTRNLVRNLVPPADPGNTATPSRDVAISFLRLANLDNDIVDRLSRYEAALWRQLAQTLFTLQALKRR